MEEGVALLRRGEGKGFLGDGFGFGKREGTNDVFHDRDGHGGNAEAAKPQAEEQHREPGIGRHLTAGAGMGDFKVGVTASFSTA